MPDDIFISYSSRDLLIAEAIRKSLLEQGVSCWMASENIAPGAAWDEAIVDALEQCRLMLLILSEKSVESWHVCNELRLAVQFGRVIVPLRIADVKPPKRMLYALGSSQWVDAFPDVAKHLEKLGRKIRLILANLSSDSPEVHVSAPEPTPSGPAVVSQPAAQAAPPADAAPRSQPTTAPVYDVGASAPSVPAPLFLFVAVAMLAVACAVGGMAFELKELAFASPASAPVGLQYPGTAPPAPPQASGGLVGLVVYLLGTIFQHPGAACIALGRGLLRGGLFGAVAGLLLAIAAGLAALAMATARRRPWQFFLEEWTDPAGALATGAGVITAIAIFLGGYGWQYAGLGVGLIVGTAYAIVQQRELNVRRQARLLGKE
ncbi:MAG TPA: toll/interleukin-1 receptor domain-containing protein [Pirellulales bacterium]|jgi:hypothetical protein|nr:toll/interleukin-1 receptor domain-containing protein [Pirellulales bacterium]